MESFDNPGATLGTSSNVREQMLVDVAQAVWTEALHACLKMFLNIWKRLQTFSIVRKLCSAGVNAPLGENTEGISWLQVYTSLKANLSFIIS